MKITVLRKMRYKNTMIYVRHLQYDFEYLFAWDGDIHSDRITIKPSLQTRILYFLGQRPLYNSDQMDEGEKIVLSGAMKTIDELLSPDYKAKRAQLKRAEENARTKVKSACLWQARETQDGFYYVCLTHGEAVKLEDGKTPVHA